jgi:hypothetical protein
VIRLYGKTTYPTRVNNGAAFLDEHAPGWRDKVDPDTLRLSSAHNCVWAQTFGHWRAEWDTYGMTVDRMERLGFIPGTGELEELTEAWKAELA